MQRAAQLIEIAGIVILLLNSIWDIRMRRIILSVTVLYGICAVVFYTTLYIRSPENLLLWLISGFIPGAVLLLLGRLTDGKIGYGDGILVTVFGLSFGLAVNLFALQIGLILLATAAILLLSLKKVKKHDSLPFVPFYAAGFLLHYVIR